MSEHYSNVKKCVFKINTADGTGSGFFLKEHGLIVTNFHVIAGHKEVAIETPNKDKHSVKVAFVNPRKDLAFLKAKETFDDLPVLQLSDFDRVGDNDKVGIVGHPFGMPITVTEGVISSKRQMIDGSEYIQTDAAVNPGNSGGPMITTEGHVIGVTTCVFRNADNVGFALPIDALKEDLAEYVKAGESDSVVVCPECTYHLTEKVEFCDNCGTELNVEALFAEFEPSPFARFIESTLKEIGIDPVSARLGQDYWEYHHGSARVRVFCYNGDTLIMTSPLVKPPKKDVQQLFEFMLSANHRPYKLGFSNGEVHLSYRVHMADLYSDHIDQIRANLIALSSKADDMDNKLVDEYGCEWAEDTKKSAA